MSFISWSGEMCSGSGSRTGTGCGIGSACRSVRDGVGFAQFATCGASKENELENSVEIKSY